jgi:hypothetical protein
MKGQAACTIRVTACANKLAANNSSAVGVGLLFIALHNVLRLNSFGVNENNSSKENWSIHRKHGTLS